MNPKGGDRSCLCCLYLSGPGFGCSNLRDGDRLFFADLYTTFAAEAFLFVDRH